MDLSGEFHRALAFASSRHRGHLRKGTGVPYLAHLLGVTSIVLEHGGTKTEAIGALLHDTVEDGKATLDEVREEFGDDVADIVDGLSDTDQPQNKPPWWPRKQKYVEPPIPDIGDTGSAPPARSALTLVPASPRLEFSKFARHLTGVHSRSVVIQAMYIPILHHAAHPERR